MKNKYRFVMNIILIITYIIVSSFVLILYASRDALSEAYIVFLPLLISAVVCIFLNKINKNVDSRAE